MPNHALHLSALTTMLRPAAEASSVPATGLPNHGRLGSIVDRQLAACRRNGTTLVVLAISLYGLEAVRQRYGDAVGKQVLHAAWTRLRSRLRASDLVVHVGNDEFGAVLLNAGGPAALVVDPRVAKALCEPYGIGALEVVISVRTGVAVYPQAGSTGEALAGAAAQARATQGDPT